MGLIRYAKIIYLISIKRKTYKYVVNYHITIYAYCINNQ